VKVLLADKFPEARLKQLRAAGHDAEYAPETSAEDLPDAITGYRALVVRSTRVGAQTMSAGNDLGLIIRAGAGVNTIDLTAATERGIQVCNVPGKNAVAVAELALGLMIAIDRRIPDNVSELRAGHWEKKRFSEARGLMGRKLGIVGLGEVGLALAVRASALGMELYAVDRPQRDPYKTGRADQIGFTMVPDIHVLAQTCDVISFHVPVNEATMTLVDRDLLDEMKPGAVVINTARGELIDEAALIEAMDRKGIRAGLDVYQDEPGSGSAEFHTKLAMHPNVYGTAHIGASTDQAQNAIADMVIRILDEFDQGRAVNAVNQLGA
jgi:D-3-phosphoglycerate dehydrogenase